MSKLLRQQIIDRLSVELSVEDMSYLSNCFDENMAAAETLASQFCPTKEINRSLLGQMEHFGIQQAVKTAADFSSFQFELCATNPSGAYYPKLTTDSFAIAIRKASSPASWDSVSYLRELAQLNSNYDKEKDLFSPIDGGESLMFMIMHVYVLPNRTAQCTLIVPSSDLKRVHFAIPLSLVIEAASKPVDESALEPIPTLKKQLSELDNPGNDQGVIGI